MPTLTDLKVDYVSLVDRAASRDPVNQSEAQRFLVWKRDNPTPEEGVSMTPEEKAALKKAQDDATAATAAIAKANEQIETLKAENAELKKAAEPAVKADEDKVDLSKADPALRAHIEKMEAERQADRERAEKSEKVAADALAKAQATDEKILKAEFVAKADGYKALVVKAEDFGPVLMRVSTAVSKEDFDALEQVLKAADEGLVAGDLFKEQGRGGDAATKADGALAEVNKRAEEIRKADPKISLAKAQDMAITADPALQARYLAETR